MTDEGKVNSVDQDKWTEMAEAVRLGLEQHIKEMPKMSACDLNYFTDALRHACFFMVEAKSFDAKLENAQKTSI